MASSDEANGTQSPKEEKGIKAALFGAGTEYGLHRPTYPDSLYSDLAAYLDGKRPQAGGSRLGVDVACGTGQASHDLAKVTDRVVGVDGSPSQISACCPSDSVTFRVGASEELPFQDEEVDLVTVAQALHWFPLETFWKEVERVLKPKGVLAVWTYGTPHLDNPNADSAFHSFHQWLHTAGYWDPKRKLVDEGYSSISFPFSDHKTHSYLMKRETSLSGFLNYVQTFSAVHTHIQRHPDQPSPVHRLGEDIARVLGVSPLSSSDRQDDPFWKYQAIPVVVTWELKLFLSAK